MSVFIIILVIVALVVWFKRDKALRTADAKYTATLIKDGAQIIGTTASIAAVELDIRSAAQSRKRDIVRRRIQQRGGSQLNLDLKSKLAAKQEEFNQSKGGQYFSAK
jgi:hypothetical protein